MNAPDVPETLEDTLREIELVLAREHAALRALDGTGIEEAAQQKSVLEERLRTLAPRAESTPTLRAIVAKIRKDAQINHALIVHARACVKGTLDLMAGRTIDMPTYSRMPKPSQQPVRVNLRG